MPSPFTSLLMAAWYPGKNKIPLWLCLLLPLSWLFAGAVQLRRALYSSGLLPRYKVDVPVIVVGNISVGGTGKTPLVLALVEYLQQRGLRAGVISRGYGGHATQYPLHIQPDTLASECGDEPLQIARRSGVPVVVDPDRVRAAQYLAQHNLCDVMISDDGLQHYRLQRDLEICVIDGARLLGNGYALPAGPLRETAARLNTVDAVVCNGEPDGALPVPVQVMSLQVQGWASIAEPQTRHEHLPVSGKVHAVAGIGHPQRFFDLLQQLGIEVIPHAFDDHHAYTTKDLQFGDALPIVMTEKDAVKCAALAPDNTWVLRVAAQLPAAWLDKVYQTVLKAKEELQRKAERNTGT